VKKAFVLGAGLGTRLHPLTEQLPKPLIPFYHRPLITWCFDHLISAGFETFMVNTHHLAECYHQAFPNNEYRKHSVELRHEDPILETAGGIKNIEDWINNESFLVYNGDILSDLPLEKAMIQEGSLGSILLDEGSWYDLGTRCLYLKGHREVKDRDFPLYSNEPLPPTVHPEAIIDPSSQVDEHSIVASGAVVEANAQLRKSILWSGAYAKENADLYRSIVRQGMIAEGRQHNSDL